MKEYWVNVYKGAIGSKYDTVEQAIALNPNAYIKKEIKYRLHVREFETREAKELYLILKE